MKYLSKEGLEYLITKIKSIFATKEELENLEYDTLKNKPSFKTINSQSILGTGDITIESGSIVDLGTFNNQTALITHVLTNQLPTGHYTFIMGIYPYFMSLREEVEYYKGTFQDSEGITVNFRVTKTGQINYLIDVNILDRITDLQDFKVDKELGKGLSTNDYTTEEKNKLAGIEAGAQVNTITGGIEESGSNANGSYIKFSDGTQICWHNYLINNVVVTTSTGALYSSMNYEWTFPASFVEAPSVSSLCNPSGGSSIFVGGVSIGSPSVMSFRIISLVSNTITVVRNSSTAVGRWK